MRHLVGCLPSTVSNLGWYGLGKMLFTARCSNVSSVVRLLLAKHSSTGLQSLGRTSNCISGCRLCFRMNSNWLGCRVLAKTARCLATSAEALCTLCKLEKSSEIADHSPPSNFLNPGKASRWLSTWSTHIMLSVPILRSLHNCWSVLSFSVSARRILQVVSLMSSRTSEIEASL